VQQTPIEAVILLTGIANPAPLKKQLEKMQLKVTAFEYADHHQFTESEIRHVIAAYEAHPSENKIILTTEKDAQRLLGNNLKELLLNLPIYHLPINIELNPADKSEFDQKILEYVASAKRFH
jgi:tetraacyldisaccharide 4'-kinase